MEPDSAAMDARPPLVARWPFWVALVAAGVSAWCIGAVLCYLLLGWPGYDAAQLTGLGALGASAGALAMFLTVFLILGQMRVQAQQLELQSDQLRYYYEPCVWLQVDYDPKQDANCNGLPVKVWSGNQASAFGLEVWSKHVAGSWANMVEGPYGCGRVKTLPHLSPADNWLCGSVRPGEEWWLLLGGIDDFVKDSEIEVRWQHPSGERWRQVWLLDRSNDSQPGKDSKWWLHALPPTRHVNRPDGKPKPPKPDSEMEPEAPPQPPSAN